jgi:hypothetical protein
VLIELIPWNKLQWLIGTVVCISLTYMIY